MLGDIKPRLLTVLQLDHMDMEERDIQDTGGFLIVLQDVIGVLEEVLQDTVDEAGQGALASRGALHIAAAVTARVPGLVAVLKSIHPDTVILHRR